MKKNNKKLTLAFVLSLSIFAPIALASCASVAKAKQNDNKNQNLNKSQPNKDADTKNMDLTPKVSMPNTNVDQSGSKMPQENNSNTNEGQNASPQNPDSSKTPESQKAPEAMPNTINNGGSQKTPEAMPNTMNNGGSQKTPKADSKTMNNNGGSQKAPEAPKTQEDQSKDSSVQNPKKPDDSQKNMDKSDSLDNTKNNNSSQEEKDKILAALKAHQIGFIDRDFMHNPNISDYKLGQFNLNLTGERPKITDNSYTFKASKISQNLEKDIDVNISLEKVTENEASRKRIATFKIVAQGYEDITKTLEWTYKTNQEFLNEVVKDGDIYRNLQRQVGEDIDETKSRAQIIPLQLQKFNHNFKSILLKNLILANFVKYHIVDDENGRVHLKFKISRGSSNKEIDLIVEGFTKVGILDKDYSGTLRNQKFDISSSSYWNGYNKYPSYNVFDPRDFYWNAHWDDQQPWLQMSFKDNGVGLIYGFELLFFWKSNYYKPNSYVVEYQETHDGEWKTIENPEILPKTTNQDYKAGKVREEVVIKKDKIHAIRIKFVNKPYYTSVVSLNPIVIQEN